LQNAFPEYFFNFIIFRILAYNSVTIFLRKHLIDYLLYKIVV